MKGGEMRVEERRAFSNILNTLSGQMEREKSYQPVDLQESKSIFWK
jgi:hypothetical protein